MPIEALEAIDELEVKLSDTEPSGFRLRSPCRPIGPLDFLDSPSSPIPASSSARGCIVTMIFDITPTVIFDGLVSERHVTPGDGANQGTLTLLGRDLSFELDKEVKSVEHPAMDETVIATLIAASYAQFGMIPMVLPPKVIDSADSDRPHPAAALLGLGLSQPYGASATATRPMSIRARCRRSTRSIGGRRSARAFRSGR